MATITAAISTVPTTHAEAKSPDFPFSSPPRAFFPNPEENSRKSPKSAEDSACKEEGIVGNTNIKSTATVQQQESNSQDRDNTKAIKIKSTVSVPRQIINEGKGDSNKVTSIEVTSQPQRDASSHIQGTGFHQRLANQNGDSSDPIKGRDASSTA